MLTIVENLFTKQLIIFFVGKCGEYQIFFVSLQRILKEHRTQSTEHRLNMNTFIGNIEARLDEKGRIFVPASYRKILAESGSMRIVMRRDTDNECLMFYPELVWNEKVEQLRQTLDEWDPEDQLILMQFMSDAEYLEMDGQGRVLLQKKNLETIGAQNDVLFVGMLNRFALWAPETFANKKLSQSELAARLRAKMSKSHNNHAIITQ